MEHLHNFALPPVLLALAEAFEKQNKPLYLVGGAVRDQVLGLPAHDFDVASPAMPQEVAALCPQGVEVRLVNPKLGTVHLVADGQIFEHTTFRSESYGSGGSHQPQAVKVGVSMKEDALRRDFSVNALYYRIAAGQLVDPTGRGLEDIGKRRLRTTTADPAIIMRDDGLRLLRLPRLAAELDFSIDRQLADCARAHAGLIRDIPRERIAPELKKLLLSDTKYPGADKGKSRPLKGLLLLEALGLVDELLPPLAQGRGMAQGEYHKYTVLMHAFHTAAAAPAEITLRLAGLLHDIAKPACFIKTGRFLGHDRKGAAMAEALLKDLGFAHDLAARVGQLVGLHMFDLTGTARESRIRLLCQKVGYETFARLADLREADVMGSGLETGPEKTAARFRTVMARMQQQKVPMSTRELAISGTDLMEHFARPAGPWIKDMLDELLRFCANYPAQNRRENLFHHVEHWSKCLAKSGEK